MGVPSWWYSLENAEGKIDFHFQMKVKKETDVQCSVAHPHSVNLFV